MYFLGKKDGFGFVESLSKNDGFVSESHFKTANGTGYAHGCTDFASVVRREVGEWEEVKDGK